MISVLWYLHCEGEGRAPDRRRRASSARRRRRRGSRAASTWTAGRTGCAKIEDNHVFNSNLFLSGKYAYYNTGFGLDPLGGLGHAGGPEQPARRSRSAARARASTSGRSTRSTSTRTTSRTRSARRTTSSSASATGASTRSPARSGRATWSSASTTRSRPASRGSIGSRSDRAHLSRRRGHEPRRVHGSLRRRHDLQGSDDARPRRPLRPPVGLGAAERDAVERRVPRPRAGHRVRADTRRPSRSTTSRRAPACTLALDESRAHDSARQLQPLRRAARHGHGRLQQPERQRRLRRYWLEGLQQRSARAAERGRLHASSSRKAAASIRPRRRRCAPPT